MPGGKAEAELSLWIREHKLFKNDSKSKEDLCRAVGLTTAVMRGSGDRFDLTIEASRESEVGVSRDPFEEIQSEDADRIALGVVCYLARGFASFFGRQRTKRDFNAAKGALNDYHQAYQLTWRLYHSLGHSHHKVADRNLDVYLSNAIEAAGKRGNPGKSAYFIWNCLLICDIFRGNIYRQMEYLNEADRYYRHADKRFLRLKRQFRVKNQIDDHSWWSKNDKELETWFISPSFILAMFERSKVQFDLGRPLESLVIQLRCLDCLVALGEHKGGAVQLRKKLESLHSFLDAERSGPTFKRNNILERFNITVNDKKEAMPVGGEESPSGADLKTQDMTALCECMNSSDVQRSLGFLAVELFARMGFTLFSLRKRRIPSFDAQENDNTDEFEWLKPYFFKFNDILNKYCTHTVLEQSSLGKYSETLFRNDTPPDHGTYPKEIEREFALRAREANCKIPAICQGLNEEGFFKRIFFATTKSISNIVTTPRRNRRVLMRRGYTYRRKYGDLRYTEYVNGFNASVGLPMVDSRERQSASGGATGNRSDDDTNSGKVTNKLVILRRWQSFNPIIPQPPGKQLLGGGYFLMWQDRGIVIDPGFDFIQNFYDEGFSLEDIHAVIITHAHPDHDDNFTSLTTLIKEWNEFHKKSGNMALEKELDIFLNETSHSKFMSWLQAPAVKVGRIVLLPTVCWNKDGGASSNGPIRGKNVKIDLRPPCPRQAIEAESPYHMVLEVVPAWHNDVIGKTSAVGLKIHLYDPDDYTEAVCVVGCTGDSGAYGLDIGLGGEQREDVWRIDKQYSDCDVLIAHLGDVRYRELSSAMQTTPGQDSPLCQLISERFLKTPAARIVNSDYVISLTQDLLNFMITLNLVPKEALNSVIRAYGSVGTGGPIMSYCTVNDWLNQYLTQQAPGLPAQVTIDTDAMIESFVALYRDNTGLGGGFPAVLLKWLREQAGAMSTVANGNNQISDNDRHAYVLLCFLATCSQEPWQYSNHLGIFGIYHLFQGMVESAKRKKVADEPKNIINTNRIFVVGELPEELSSYRHWIARCLNATVDNRDKDGKRVHAFTGDIGLHVGLGVHRSRVAESGDTARHVSPTIRCTYCNYNNEAVCRSDAYHDPENIVEIPIASRQSAMIYLCKTRHSPGEDANCPDQYHRSPPLRVV